MLQLAKPDSRQAEKTRYQRFIWCDWANLIVGAWLITAALSFDHVKTEPFWSDIICGIAIFTLSAFGLAFKSVVHRWPIGFIGTWMLFAPLVLWTKSPRVFEMDMLLACLAISFSFLIPGLPGEHPDVESGGSVPKGWSYNPSSWNQRLPLICMGMIGFFAARYLACYQLGYMNSVWDPIFGDGTVKVLTSKVSQAFPVSDAGLGALSYLVDSLAGALGSANRWRTMPWMVLLFGLLIIPAGVTSIVLVMLQPISVGAWCSICLSTAALMLFMVPLAFDEVIASCQFLSRGVKNGKSFWRLLLFGAKGDEQSTETTAGGAKVPDVKTEAPPESSEAKSDTGITVPWNLALSTIVAIFVMFIPDLLNSIKPMSAIEYIAGALAVTNCVCALAEPCRSVRLLNIPVGLTLIITPYLVTGGQSDSIIADLICGLTLCALSIPKGKIQGRFGSLSKWIV